MNDSTEMYANAENTAQVVLNAHALMGDAAETGSGRDGTGSSVRQTGSDLVTADTEDTNTNPGDPGARDDNNVVMATVTKTGPQEVRKNTVRVVTPSQVDVEMGPTVETPSGQPHCCEGIPFPCRAALYCIGFPLLTLFTLVALPLAMCVCVLYLTFFLPIFNFQIMVFGDNTSFQAGFKFYSFRFKHFYPYKVYSVLGCCDNFLNSCFESGTSYISLLLSACRFSMLYVAGILGCWLGSALWVYILVVMVVVGLVMFLVSAVVLPLLALGGLGLMSFCFIFIWLKVHIHILFTTSFSLLSEDYSYALDNNFFDYDEDGGCLYNKAAWVGFVIATALYVALFPLLLVTAVVMRTCCKRVLCDPQPIDSRYHY